MIVLIIYQVSQLDSLIRNILLDIYLGNLIVWPPILKDLYKYFDELWISSEFTFRAFGEFKKQKRLCHYVWIISEINIKP